MDPGLRTPRSPMPTSCRRPQDRPVRMSSITCAIWLSPCARETPMSTSTPWPVLAARSAGNSREKSRRQALACVRRNARAKLQPAKEVRMQRSFPTLAVFTVIGGLIVTEASAQVVRQEVAGIRNFAKIESTVACAGAITPAAIQDIKTMGYASIINLRLATEQGADIEGHTAMAKT